MPVGSDGPVDALATLTLDEAGADAPAAVPSPEAQPTAGTDAPPPDPTTETPAASPPAPAGLAPAPEPPTPIFSPPTGEPFTLRVDRNTIPLEGAVQTPDGGVWFPADIWRKVSGSFIGDRQGWLRERQALQAQVQQTTEARSQKELQVDAALAKVHALFSNPELLEKEYANWQVNGPRLQAEAALEAAQTERDQLAAQVQRQQEQEQAAVLLPRMQEYLGQQLTQVLGSEFGGVFSPEQAQALQAEIWQHHAQDVFYEDQRGTIFVNPETLRDIVERRAGYLRQVKSGQAVVEKAKATNAAAVAPTKPATGASAKAGPPNVPRDDAGRFQKPTRKQDKQAARALLDDLTLEDASA